MDNLRFFHGGNIYDVKRKHRKDVIDFSANINPLGLPLKVKKAISEGLDKILHYPDLNARNITQKIAKYWRIDEQNILLGNGSSELIYLISSTFRPKTSLIVVPTFSEYECSAKIIKCRTRFLKLKEKEDFRFNPPHFNNVDLFFLCNPNNPTGNLILQKRQLIEKLTDGLIVVDEAFMDFLPDQKNYTFIWKAVKQRRIIVLRSFTKFFALPGLRMGYVIAHKEIINALRRHQPPWSTNSLAQVAAETILGDKEYIKNSYLFIVKERDFLFRELDRMKGLKVYPSVTNFILCRLENTRIQSAGILRQKLIKQGILIRNCNNFKGLNDRFFRTAVRKRSENIKLIAALKGILQ